MNFSSLSTSTTSPDPARGLIPLDVTYASRVASYLVEVFKLHRLGRKRSEEANTATMPSFLDCPRELRDLIYAEHFTSVSTAIPPRSCTSSRSCALVGAVRIEASEVVQLRRTPWTFPPRLTTVGRRLFSRRIADFRPRSPSSGMLARARTPLQRDSDAVYTRSMRR